MEPFQQLITIIANGIPEFREFCYARQGFIPAVYEIVKLPKKQQREILRCGWKAVKEYYPGGSREYDRIVEEEIYEKFGKPFGNFSSIPSKKVQLHVYFAQAINGGPIKIGCAADVEKRLKSLQVGSPTPIKLLGVIHGGGRKKENELHKRFAAQRLEGEWFAISADLMEEIIKANMEEEA